MQQFRSTQIYLLALVALLLGTVDRVAAGSCILRGGRDCSIDEVQAEDYVVMQMEIAWGMKEMKRYRTHRGDFPTREDSTKQPKLRASTRSNNKISREEASNFVEIHEQPHPTSHETNNEEAPGVSEAANIPPNNKTDGSVTRLKQARATKDVDVNDTINLLLDTTTAIRTVGDYWDFLVSMF